MQNTIVYREYQKEDAPFLEDIIRKTWQYDRFCGPDTAKRMARLYLLSCLTSQTFTRVALKDNRPVGIIMARALRQKASRKFRGSFVKAVLSMLCHKEDRAILKAYDGISSVDEELLKTRGEDYDGELAFFVLDESCRGLGVGKALFENALTYLKSQGIEKFYLYTDSSCNYGFYEHQGMKRCGETLYSVQIGMENKMHFYLYEYPLGRH